VYFSTELTQRSRRGRQRMVRTIEMTPVLRQMQESLSPFNCIFCVSLATRTCNVWRNNYCYIIACACRCSILIGPNDNALWHYVNSHLLLNQTSFEMVRQTGCCYVNSCQLNTLVCTYFVQPVREQTHTTSNLCFEYGQFHNCQSWSFITVHGQF